MSDDIVERLRVNSFDSREIWKLLDEAAEEIERLKLVSKMLNEEVEWLRTYRNRWREIAVAYRIGMSANGHRMYDELVEEDR